MSSSFGAGDLDLYLIINGARTTFVTSSAGTAMPEAFSYAVSPGTWYIAVSSSDDGAPQPALQPYTLTIR